MAELAFDNEPVEVLRATEVPSARMSGRHNLLRRMLRPITSDDGG